MWENEAEAASSGVGLPEMEQPTSEQRPETNHAKSFEGVSVFSLLGELTEHYPTHISL